MLDKQISEQKFTLPNTVRAMPQQWSYFPAPVSRLRGPVAWLSGTVTAVYSLPYLVEWIERLGGGCVSDAAQAFLSSL